MPDQPTDAGKDREAATGIVGNVSDYLLGDTAGVLANTIFLALQQARREGQAQERRQAVRDGFDAGEDFCCGRLDMREWSTEKVERFRAERERLIAAAIRAREEPSR